MSIAVVMLPHSLQDDIDAHLSARDMDSAVKQIKVRKLPVDAIVYDMERPEFVVERLVYDDHSLQRAALERQGSY